MTELNDFFNPYRMDLNYYYFNNLFLLIEELVCDITKYAKQNTMIVKQMSFSIMLI